MYGITQKVIEMGELISMAEYRQKQQRSRVSRILDIQAEQLCGIQQSAQRDEKVIAEEYRNWMSKDSTDEI